MRSEPSLARSRTRGQRTATGPMPVIISRSGRCPWRTSRWRPSSVSLSAWLASKTATSASTACASSARAPLRRISVSGSAKVPGWQSWKTLALVTAYHSFGGEVEASSTPTIRRLTPSCRHQLSLIAQPCDGSECRPSFRMGWGPGAEQIYDEVRQNVERETDDRRRELFWRSAEKTVRIATIVAAGCLSKTVNRDHMEWARQLVMQSDETLLAGVQEYMEEEKLEFGELCREIIRRVKREGGSMSRREVGRSFQNNLRYGPELRRAIDHLIDTEQLMEWKEETGGRPSWWLELPPPTKPTGPSGFRRRI